MAFDHTYEDLILEAQYVKPGEELAAFARAGDGNTYSRAIHWQSPEGNFYGQKRVVRDFEIRVVWDGQNYWQCNVPSGYVATVEDLPEDPQVFGRFWAVATGVDIKDRNGEQWEGPWKIYYYDVNTTSWKPVEWLWKIDNHASTPNPGVRRGAGHVVVFHDVTMMWDGLRWKRAHKHSNLLDDEKDRHVPEGFIAGVTELQGDHNQLLEDFFGYQETVASQFIDTTNYVNEQFDDVSDLLDELSANVDDFSSDLLLSLSESNSLALTVEGLLAESVELVTLGAELGIAPEDTGYQAALTALRNGVAPWINQAHYPLAITVADRVEIQRLITEVQSAKTALIEAVSNNQTYRVRDYTREEIAKVNTALTSVSETFDTLSSDLSITLAEANSLKVMMTTLWAESDFLLSEAADLGLTAYGNSYLIALIELDDELLVWTTQSTYPAAITLDDRGTLKHLFTEVKSKKAILDAALITAKDDLVTSYVSDQIDEVGVAIDALSEGIDKFSSDGYITLAEANGLKQVRDSAIKESDEFIVVATSLELTAEITAYQNAIDALVDELDSWVDNPPYPRAITPEDRANVKSLIDAVQSTKVTIINAIQGAQVTAGIDSVDFDISQFRTQYDGFIRGFTTELELVFVSDNELSLRPNYGEYDYLKVNEQNIAASKRTSVFAFTPVLNWTESTQTLSTTTLQPDRTTRPYYVYLADRSSGFLLRDYDYRGRLFCSDTTQSSNYLGDTGLGRNAILVGTIDTNNEAKFVNILSSSLISRTSDLKEVYREFSDFDLVFTNENTLTLELNYGCYGQIYIPESLYYIGQGRKVHTTSPRITINPDGSLQFVYTSASASTLYYVYMAGNLDIYNNNLQGSDGRPLQPGDYDYNADKDLRLWLFLSTQPPDNGRLGESYYGFWTRHVGQVMTDAKGKFVYSAGISAIRQATLNATHLDGLAEVAIYHDTIYEFKVIKKKGTSGILMVGGDAVLTYDPLDPIEDNREKVHKINIHDLSQVYDEDNVLSPLSDGPEVSTLVGQNLYVYMANSHDFWGAFANKLFVSTDAPIGGYISQNWPGNNARWVATVQLTPGALGAELVTNGAFSTSDNWTLGSGWEFNSDNSYMVHTSGTASLSQSISITEGQSYQVSYSLVECTSGSVAAHLGGTVGLSYSIAGTAVSNLVAGSSGLVELVPSENFTVSVDNISVRAISSGDFSGTYLRDGIGVITGVIEDSNVATNTTWSSNKLQSEFNKLRALVTASGTVDQQKQTGIPVRLEYLDTTHVRLVPTVDSPLVVFSDITSEMVIPNSGIDLTINGDTDTFYYVWLTPVGLEMNEDPPLAEYAKIMTRGEGSTKILVGYIGCSATNTIASNWNVFSLYGEPYREWSGNSINTNGASTSQTWIGAVTAPTTQFFGRSTGTSMFYGSFAWYMDGGGLGIPNYGWYYVNAFNSGNYTVTCPDRLDFVYSYYYDSENYEVLGAKLTYPPGGYATGYGWTGDDPNVKASVDLSVGVYAAVVNNSNVTLTNYNTSITHNAYVSPYNSNRWYQTYWSCNGNLVLCRPASDW